MSDNVQAEIQSNIRDSGDIEDEYVEEFFDLFDAKYNNVDFDAESVQLTRMAIKGFKAIPELDIPLSDRATILHGRNSQGKSSFIEATRFNLLGRREDDPLITKPIRKGFDKLQTNGYWEKAGRQYLVHREMERNQSYEGHNEPVVVENPEENNYADAERHSQSSVNDLIGITPLYEEGFDRFNIFSLFCIISGDFKSFIQWDESADFIDLLFGINLSSVTRAIDNEIEDCELTDEELEAKVKLQMFRQRAKEINNEITELVAEREDIEKELSEKIERRDELANTLDNKSEINSLLSKEIDIKDDISDLQSRLENKQDEYRSIKQEISKLESETAAEEVGPALQEMKHLISVPNRCPICTKDVDEDKIEQFHKEEECPLCGKDVPEDRYDTTSEVDRKGEQLEQEKRKEELEDLEGDRRTVEGEIEFLEEQIKEKQDKLATFTQRINENSFTEYVEERDRLETEIGELRDKRTSLELSIDAKKGKLHEVARSVWTWTQLEEERYRKEKRTEALESFRDIVTERRRVARRNLKNRLEQRMESLLEIFTEGTFEFANGVVISKGETYDYTIYTRRGEELEPGLLKETDAELSLHMLLFHTTILAELQEQANSPPLKLVLIDSPYANEPDNENAADVTDFLTQLPQILESYQLLVTMADSTLAKQDVLDRSFTLEQVGDHV